MTIIKILLGLLFIYSISMLIQGNNILISISFICFFIFLVYLFNKFEKISFGKYKGKSWNSIPDDYLLWLRFNGNNYRVKAKAQAEYFKRHKLHPHTEIKKLYEKIFLLEKKIPKVPSQEEKDGMKKAGDEFEKHVGQCYENEGYTVEYRGLKLGLEDGGIDLIARKNNELLLIQCKYWKKENSITPNLVKEFYGSCNFYIDQHSLNKKNITCIYAVANQNSISYGAYKLFQENYVNCRFKVVN